jgi:DNA-binding NarL/FixJ family response regulator
MFREHIGQLINRDLGMEVCGEADNIKDAMTLICERKPDIAIVDITLRGSSGLELLKDLKAQEIDLPVLVLSMHDEDLYAERSLRAGAKGYITKNEASSEVVKGHPQGDERRGLCEQANDRPAAGAHDAETPVLGNPGPRITR